MRPMLRGTDGKASACLKNYYELLSPSDAIKKTALPNKTKQYYFFIDKISDQSSPKLTKCYFGTITIISLITNVIIMKVDI